MLILLGMFLIIISLLLFSYYRMKANEDDLNRPSFFNSKIRKYFLFFLIVLLFLTGNFLLMIDGYYNLVWFLPLIYYISYIFIRLDWRHKIVIFKVFQYYKAFSNPDLPMTQNEQLMTPVLYMLATANLPKNYQNKARKYLEDRIKKGKIKSVKDLPNEAWILLESVGKTEISDKDVDKIPLRKIDYYYEEIIENKEHRNFSTIAVDWLWRLEASFDRLFSNFSFVCLPRPDFTGEEVQLADGKFYKTGETVSNQIIQYAVFPQISGQMAKKFGWVATINEYSILAALEFQRRFPEHKFSKQIKKQHKYSDQQIFDYAQNWEKLDVNKIKLF